MSSWHTQAMDRGMLEGGLDDVGIGALFGLYDWRYEVMGLLMHAEHLEAVSGVGPHTISFPRLLPAEGVDYTAYKLVNDEDFKRLIAVTRLAVPYTGMILTTRETAQFRRDLLDIGMSQMSAGSCVGVGGYAHPGFSRQGEAPQFRLADERKPEDVIKALVRDGYLPSFCTACYRSGRTGDRFMPLAKSGEISNFCQPNAMLTFKEYLLQFRVGIIQQIFLKRVRRQFCLNVCAMEREICVFNFLFISEGGLSWNTMQEHLQNSKRSMRILI